MKTIYKYRLELTDLQFVNFPQVHELLSVGIQHGDMFLWAGVDPDTPATRTEIQIVGTGNPIHDPWRFQYLGTVMQSVFVWHIFYAVRPV